MDTLLTPSQVASQLNVATITVYKWIEANKIQHEKVMAGHSVRIYITREALELKRAELLTNRKHGSPRGLPPCEEDEPNEWIKKYEQLIGAKPPLYLAFKRNQCTLEQMISEANRRFEFLSKI
jgi:excisionase family DNA binding protein